MVILISDINDKKLFVTLLMLVSQVIDVFIKIGVHSKFSDDIIKKCQPLWKNFLIILFLLCELMCVPSFMTIE